MGSPAPDLTSGARVQRRDAGACMHFRPTRQGNVYIYSMVLPLLLRTSFHPPSTQWPLTSIPSLVNGDYSMEYSISMSRTKQKKSLEKWHRNSQTPVTSTRNSTGVLFCFKISDVPLNYTQVALDDANPSYIHVANRQGSNQDANDKIRTSLLYYVRIRSTGDGRKGACLVASPTCFPSPVPVPSVRPSLSYGPGSLRLAVPVTSRCRNLLQFPVLPLPGTALTATVPGLAETTSQRAA